MPVSAHSASNSSVVVTGPAISGSASYFGRAYSHCRTEGSTLTVLAVQVRNTKDVELATHRGAQSTADARLTSDESSWVALGDRGGGCD